MKKNSNIYLYCFSPLVMITTFAIELCSAMYVLFRYRMDLSARLITATLGFLALFQFAEYMICQSSILLSSLDWAKIGYMAITILPPLTLHLGLTIAKRKNNHLLGAAYGSAAIFTTYFLFVGQGIHSSQCLGNYVIFNVDPSMSMLYGVYYHGWLFIGIFLFMRMRSQIENIERKQALIWLTIGYLSFLVPTSVVLLLDPATVRGIPSIMCGFAILMALCLLFKVAPLVLKNSKSDPLPLRIK